MKSIPLLLFTIIIMMLSSCVGWVETTTKKNFTFCYDGKNTGIDSLINNEGYYLIKHIYNSVDTADYVVMFYADGTFVRPGVPRVAGRITQSSTSLYFKEIIQNPQGKNANLFHDGSQFGRYIIDGDIIKAQYIDYRVGGGLGPRTGWEDWYKIINRNTILEINKIPLFNINKGNWEIDKKKIKYETAHFVPLAIRPTPDCWLKKEKWFWCK